MMPVIPKAIPPSAAAVFKDVFTAEELTTLESFALKAKEEGGTGAEKDKLRKSKIVWLDFVDKNIPVYQRLAALVADANAVNFRFDIVGLGEPIQLARYEATDQGHYDWHQDFGNTSGVSRKLSLTVQLTDGDKYEGGELQIFRVANDVLIAPRERGSVIVFPSYQLHRVTPVTKGVRHSLTAWVSGPAFR